MAKIVLVYCTFVGQCRLGHFQIKHQLWNELLKYKLECINYCHTLICRKKGRKRDWSMNEYEIDFGKMKRETLKQLWVKSNMKLEISRTTFVNILCINNIDFYEQIKPFEILEIAPIYVQYTIWNRETLTKKQLYLFVCFKNFNNLFDRQWSDESVWLAQSDRFNSNRVSIDDVYVCVSVNLNECRVNFGEFTLTAHTRVHKRG